MAFEGPDRWRDSGVNEWRGPLKGVSLASFWIHLDCGLGRQNTGLERFIREPLVCQSKALSSVIL